MIPSSTQEVVRLPVVFVISIRLCLSVQLYSLICIIWLQYWIVLNAYIVSGS